MLGDLILNLMKACTTLWRWALPTPQRSVLEEDAALPPFHFTDIREPSAKDRYDAWWARYILRTDPRAHEQAMFNGEQIKSRWQFEPGMRHYSPSYKPFTSEPTEEQARAMRDDYRRATRNRLIDALYNEPEVLPPGVSYIGKSKRTP